MPRIELIDVPLYNATDPYHFEIDNVPLRNLIDRQELINLSLDNVLKELRDAIGTQGSLANRLNQSIEQDGSLKTVAIDDAEHSIEAHEDTVAFVRMLREESDKLTLISDEATDLTLEFQNSPGADVDFSSGETRFRDSATITWSVTAPNLITANMAFPATAAHRHWYTQEPVHSDIVEPDFINYKVNASSSVIVEGSLRVVVNGVRINEDEAIYVPGPLVDDPWMLLSYTAVEASGTFQLSTAISDDDNIVIDYDIALV
jgi:hypothetical protein